LNAKRHLNIQHFLWIANYQPICECHSGIPHHLEVLARNQHPFHCCRFSL
jgi:EAL domain-containing protein (putative c-di-GMP-specific phosphodiesterase class I)